MRELEKVLERHLPEGLKNWFPLRAENLEEFIGFVDANGVTRVAAEVYSIDGGRYVSPSIAPFIRSGNSDSTVYFGVSEKGRKIFFHEEYEDPKNRWNFRSEIDRKKAAVRSLITADDRLTEVQERLSGVTVAIEAGGRDMDEETLREIVVTAIELNLSPYPKGDPRFAKLAEDWDRIQRSF